MTVKDLLKVMAGKPAKRRGSSASASALAAAGGGPAGAASGGCAFPGCAAAVSTQCSRCTRESYCGKEHQSLHWRMRHSDECTAPAVVASAAPDDGRQQPRRLAGRRPAARTQGLHHWHRLVGILLDHKLVQVWGAAILRGEYGGAVGVIVERAMAFTSLGTNSVSRRLRQRGIILSDATGASRERAPVARAQRRQRRRAVRQALGGALQPLGHARGRDSVGHGLVGAGALYADKAQVGHRVARVKELHRRKVLLGNQVLHALALASDDLLAPLEGQAQDTYLLANT